MMATSGITDTVAGPNLVSSELLSPKHSSKIKTGADPGTTSATKKLVNVERMITIQVQLGNLRVRTRFSVFKNL